MLAIAISATIASLGHEQHKRHRKKSLRHDLADKLVCEWLLAAIAGLPTPPSRYSSLGGDSAAFAILSLTLSESQTVMYEVMLALPEETADVLALSL